MERINQHHAAQAHARLFVVPGLMTNGEVTISLCVTYRAAVHMDTRT